MCSRKLQCTELYDDTTECFPGKQKWLQVKLHSKQCQLLGPTCRSRAELLSNVAVSRATRFSAASLGLCWQLLPGRFTGFRLRGRSCLAVRGQWQSCSVCGEKHKFLRGNSNSLLGDYTSIFNSIWNIDLIIVLEYHHSAPQNLTLTL